MGFILYGASISMDEFPSLNLIWWGLHEKSLEINGRCYGKVNVGLSVIIIGAATFTGSVSAQEYSIQTTATKQQTTNAKRQTTNNKQTHTISAMEHYDLNLRQQRVGAN